MEDIRVAIEQGDVDTIRNYVNSNIEIPQNFIDEEGLTVLHAAVKSKNLQIIDLFLGYYERKNLNLNIRVWISLQLQFL